MHNFKIVAAGKLPMTFELRADDGSAALNVMSRTPIPEADVWRDGEYIFSVRKECRDRFWSIFQKPELAHPYGRLN